MISDKTYSNGNFVYFCIKNCHKISVSGSVINGLLNTTTHTNVNLEDTSNNLDDGQDIGVIGKGKSIRFN